MAASILGFVGVCFALGISSPQLWVSFVRRRVAGLSFASLLNSAFSSAAWMVFSFLDADTWLFISSSVYLVASVALLVAIFWLGGSRGDWKISAAWGLALVFGTSLLVFDVDVLGVLLIFGAFAWAGPQLVQAWRKQDTSGVSAVSWGVAFIDAVVWLAYGLVSGSAVLVGWALVAASCSFLIVVGVSRHRTVALRRSASRHDGNLPE